MVKGRIRNDKERSGGDNGSVLVISMIVMVFLALIGLAATTTTSIEIGVAGNEKAYKENLYRAEAAAMAGAQRLENEKDDSALEYMKTGYGWLNTRLPYSDPADPSNWEDTEENAGIHGSAESMDPGARFLAVYEGIARGASLGMDEPTLRVFSIYGRSKHNRGRMVVQVGYKKRF